MSDFEVKVTATLDTSQLQSQLSGFQAKLPVELEINTASLSKLNSALSSASKNNKMNVDTSGLDKASSKVKEVSSSMKQLSNFSFKSVTGGLDTEMSKLESTITKLESQTMSGAGTQELQTKVSELRDEYEQLKVAQTDAMDAMTGGDMNQAAAAVDNYNMQLKTVQNEAQQLKSEFTEMVSPLQRLNLTNQIESWLQNNTRASKEAKEELQSYVDTMNSAGGSLSEGAFRQMQTGFKEIDAEETAMGNTGKSWLNTFEQAFSRIGQFTGIYRVTSQIPRMFMGLANNVLEVNSALIELRKVSDATDVELSKSFEHATESAQEYGASISEIINSQADWARLGYTVPEAEELADTTTLLQTVGDNMTQESSSEGLIAVLRGFQYDASQAEDIVDIVNEVANNEPIDTSGLFDALERSASSLYAANNTLEESVALVTTANSVVQNPESVGTTMKTKICLYVQKCAYRTHLIAGNA